MGYCGNNFGISACVGDAALQRGSTPIGKMLVHHLAIQTLALSSRGAELCHTRQTQLRNRQINITMFCAAVMAAVTGRSISSLSHLMTRDGLQIL